MRQAVDRVLVKLGMKRDPVLKEALRQSEDIRNRINARLDLADAIREQARRDEQRIQRRLR